jgi:hypothetical protein
LEDTLILEELTVLYEKTVDRQQRLIKAVAGAMGAEIDDDSDSSTGGSRTYDSNVGGYVPRTITNEADVRAIPIGIGYESNL